MDSRDIEILLKKSIGLNAASIGVSAIERAVRHRVQACSLKDWREYATHIRASEMELQALIEAVVVPETWFFRDKTAFSAMVSLAQRRWLAAHPTGTLRLLSAPCSTGEEPYSMAMALLDAGFPPERFHRDREADRRRGLEAGADHYLAKNSFHDDTLIRAVTDLIGEAAA